MIGFASQRVYMSSQYEQQITQPIEILNNFFADRFPTGSSQGYHASLGSAANAASHVQRDRSTSPHRQDELPQWRETRFALIDHFLDPSDFRGVGQFCLGRDRIGRSQFRADSKQTMLNSSNDRIDFAGQSLGTSQAEKRIQLIDGSIRFNASVVFRHPSSSEQPGLTAIACLGVDLHVGLSRKDVESTVFYLLYRSTV